MFDGNDSVRTILITMRRGQITITHELIAIAVIVFGVTVREIADRLGMKRSNNYQQLHRTRKITKDIMDRMEVPLMAPMYYHSSGKQLPMTINE